MYTKEMPEFEYFWKTFMRDICTAPLIADELMVEDYEKWMTLSSSHKKKLKECEDPFKLFDEMLKNKN